MPSLKDNYVAAARAPISKAEMTLDGKKVSDPRMEFLPSFFATAGYDRKGKRVVLKATNYFKQPLWAEIQLDGADSMGAPGQHIVIRSDKPTDENSLDNPRRIVPEEQPLPASGKSVSVTLPPGSVNVLRIPVSVK